MPSRMGGMILATARLTRLSGLAAMGKMIRLQFLETLAMTSA